MRLDDDEEGLTFDNVAYIAFPSVLIDLYKSDHLDPTEILLLARIGVFNYCLDSNADLSSFSKRREEWVLKTLKKFSTMGLVKVESSKEGRHIIPLFWRGSPE